MKRKTLSAFLSIFRKQGRRGEGRVASPTTRYFQVRNQVKYPALSTPSLLGICIFFFSPLKLSTCKRYVGICREINIWSSALEKQLGRRHGKAMIWGLAKISPPFQALEFCRQPALSGGGWGIASQTQPVGEANPVLVV